jgi:serine O-acetyltransferase
MNQKEYFTPLVHAILEKRQTHKCVSQLKSESIDFLIEVIDFLFPHFSSRVYYSPEDVFAKIQLLERNLISLLKTLHQVPEEDEGSLAREFVRTLPGVHTMLWNDAEAIFQGDPAAESIDEVILAYPGFFAIMIYRVAHELYRLKLPIIPRILTEYAHEKTGVDIHPGAVIGSPFFIDHGTGIVIGETSVIGKNVKVYQGVTLGALSVNKDLARVKRHPTIEDDVVIYSQAVILGGDTVIGKNSIVGGNAWVTESVAPDSIVYSKSEVRIRSNEKVENFIDYII